MKAQRPYLLRALYEWLVDSDVTPYLLVRVDSDAVQVPMDYVKDGQIVLNISPSAVRDLFINDDSLSFDGRFGGKPFAAWIPLSHIAAIYAKENGQGMIFDQQDSVAQTAESAAAASERADASAQADGNDAVADTSGKDAGSGGRGHLKVIK